MSGWLFIALLYVLGMILLIVELFLPAYGLLGLIGVGVLGLALYETHQRNDVAALIGLAVIAVCLPLGLIFSVKNWHRTPVGRRLAPPNPTLTADDRMPVEHMRVLVGTVGRSLTRLRPVGTCEFDGRRVECKAEYGMIEKGVSVQAVRLVDRTLLVREVPSPRAERVDV